MLDVNDPDTRSELLFPSFNLKKVNERWLASPPEAANSHDRFLPFYLPLPPRSIVEWLVIAGHRFGRQRRRCMVGFLLVDTASARWTVHVPQQRCGVEHAETSFLRPASSNLPDTMRIGGTFQTVNGNDSLQQLVPPTNGFHFVLSARSPSPMPAYIRHADGLDSIDPIKVVSNDWEQAIHAAIPRLRIA